ncbi:MAG: choice-of-anchor D domain-containing protein [Solirubrobacterales bacterium]
MARRGGARLGWGAGVCLLVTLGVAAPAGAHIWWTNQGSDSIGRARPNGEVAIRNFIATADAPHGVAIDDGHVYWAQGASRGSIGRARLNGSGATQNFIRTGENVRGVALDSFGIYWSHLVSGAGAIGRANLDGSGVNPIFISTSGPPCGVAVDPDKLYWANSGDPGALGRAHGPFDVDPTFINAGGDPCGVAVTNDYIYWANRGGNTIGRAWRDGTHVRQSFIPAQGACGVAVNESRIYWTSTATNSIGAARLDGTGINPFLIKGASAPCGIAVDPTASASPRSYQYPPTKVGGRGQIHAFFIQNTSSSVLGARRVRIAGQDPDDFKRTGDGCSVVATPAGGGCVVNVRFSPVAPGDRAATILVSSNASDSPTSIPVSGFGISP